MTLKTTILNPFMNSKERDFIDRSEQPKAVWCMACDELTSPEYRHREYPFLCHDCGEVQIERENQNEKSA